MRTDGGTRERLVDEERRHERARAPVSEAALWVGVLLAPAAWALSLLVGYALTGPPCTTAASVALVLVTVLSAAAAVAGGLVARRAWRRMRDAPAPSGSGSEDERDGGVPAEREQGDGPAPPPSDMPHRSANDRRRLMAHGGMILSVLTTVIVVGHGIGILVLGPCR